MVNSIMNIIHLCIKVLEISFTHKNTGDKMKKDICRKLGIKLVEVPYTTHIDDIPSYIETKLQQLGY